jgi:Flp pilus assembly protein TadG
MGFALSGAPRRTRGQALVETALAVPVLLIIMAGIIEFGRAWGMSQVVTDAARQGARTASILNDSSADQDSVDTVVERALATGGVDPDDAVIDIDGWQDGTGTEVAVEVEVEYEFWLVGPVFALMRGDWDRDSITLRSRAVMRNE